MQISEYQIYIKEHSLWLHRICDLTCQTFYNIDWQLSLFFKKGWKMQINYILLCKKMSSRVFNLIASATRFRWWVSSLVFFLRPKVTSDCSLFHGFHSLASWSKLLPRRQTQEGRWLRTCMYLWWKSMEIQSPWDAPQRAQTMGSGSTHVWNGSQLPPGLQLPWEFHQEWNAATSSCARTAAFLAIFVPDKQHLEYSSNWIGPLQDLAGRQRHLANNTMLVWSTQWSGTCFLVFSRNSQCDYRQQLSLDSIKKAKNSSYKMSLQYI